LGWRENKKKAPRRTAKIFNGTGHPKKVGLEIQVKERRLGRIGLRLRQLQGKKKGPNCSQNRGETMNAQMEGITEKRGKTDMRQKSLLKN